MKLSDIKIKNIKGNGKVQKLSDGEGLFLYVTAEGKKFWRLAYRFGGKQKTLSIGPYEMIGLKEARDKRYEAKKRLLEGIDPGEQKKAAKAAAIEAQQEAGNTFEAIAREWYPIRERQVSERQAHRVLRYLETNAFSAFGAKPISEIKAPEELKTSELCFAAVQDCSGALEFVPEHLQNEIDAAVKQAKAESSTT